MAEHEDCDDSKITKGSTQYYKLWSKRRGLHTSITRKEASKYCGTGYKFTVLYRDTIAGIDCWSIKNRGVMNNRAVYEWMFEDNMFFKDSDFLI